jgi:hypothetical protein
MGQILFEVMNRLRAPRVMLSHHRAVMLGLAVITGVALALRLWHVGAGLPLLPTSDEVTVVTRADLVLHHHVPHVYDWPSGSMVILAAVLRFLGLFDHSFLVDGSRAQYVVARLLSVAAGCALVPLTALLAAELTPKARRRGPAAIVAGTLIALAYTSVRMSRVSHPEVEQSCVATGEILASVLYVRLRRPSLAIAAGVLAGLAGALKYLGGASVIVVVVACFVVEQAPWRRRAVLATVSTAAALGTFVLLVPGSIMDSNDFWTGVKGQFLHQANGHLGYDSPHPALGFYLTQALPGNLGPILAIAIVAGVLAAAVFGSVAHRLVVLYVVVAVGALGASHVDFPHYLLVALPCMIALAVSSIWRFLPPRPILQFVAIAVVVGLCAGTFVNDLKLVATSRDTDTRTIASAVVTNLKGAVVRESYTTDASVHGGTVVAAIGLDPAVEKCSCYVVISSYMEDRYRQEPHRYAQEVAVYDYVRSHGQQVYSVGPSKPLSYRWDLLPQWGESRLSLGREVVGPTITVMRIPG